MSKAPPLDIRDQQNIVNMRQLLLHTLSSDPHQRRAGLYEMCYIILYSSHCDPFNF